MAGLSFSDIDDADIFYNKITTREIASSKKVSKSSSSSGKKQKGKILLIV